MTRAWAVATARRPWAGLTLCVYMDVHASGSRSLLRAATLYLDFFLVILKLQGRPKSDEIWRIFSSVILPTGDACSSSLSTTVIKFSIFSDPTRKLSALPPELRRIR